MEPMIELAEQYRAFLQKLIDDDDYRAEFERDPGAVLAREGVQVERNKLPRRVRLPSKEALRAELAQPLEALAKKGPGGLLTHSPFSHGFLMPGDP